MAATRYISYVTYAGDRWDTVAWKFYGNATRFHAIIVANFAVPIYPVFPAGIQLSIPVLGPDKSTQKLPPWLKDKT
jgi:phage tail protein X